MTTANVAIAAIAVPARVFRRDARTIAPSSATTSWTTTNALPGILALATNGRNRMNVCGSMMPELWPKTIKYGPRDHTRKIPPIHSHRLISRSER